MVLAIMIFEYFNGPVRVSEKDFAMGPRCVHCLKESLALEYGDADLAVHANIIYIGQPEVCDHLHSLVLVKIASTFAVWDWLLYGFCGSEVREVIVNLYGPSTAPKGEEDTQNSSYRTSLRRLVDMKLKEPKRITNIYWFNNSEFLMFMYKSGEDDSSRACLIRTETYLFKAYTALLSCELVNDECVVVWDVSTDDPLWGAIRPSPEAQKNTADAGEVIEEINKELHNKHLPYTKSRRVITFCT